MLIYFSSGNGDIEDKLLEMLESDFESSIVNREKIALKSLPWNSNECYSYAAEILPGNHF